MGLAGEKKRMKLSHDPNNTKWTNDTSSFGLKIMTSQGWQPGQYLGAKDAAHAEFHTAANVSHIRVAIKDDNLGLGAKIGTGVGHGECTGLDAFKNLLGRLNGKDEEEIIKEQQSRDDLRRAIYSERKWGTQRFVSGGFLIGDKIQILIDAEAERIQKLALGENEDSSSDLSSASDSEEEAAPIEKTKKSKKRKLEVLEEAEPEVVALKVKKSKKSKKARKNQDPVEEESAPSEDEKATKKSKKSKKDRKPKGEVEDTEEEKRKKEKKEKKERKMQEKAVEETEETEKEKRRREKKEKREKKKAAEEDTPEVSESSLPTTKESTPLATPSSGRSTPMMQGRHAVRSRYIAQKRLASMDAASLNQVCHSRRASCLLFPGTISNFKQIFMIKSQ
ncbi:telomerase inhibitor [Cadophora gregata f. sp. sojae]|nr:telomerase inhibitor [Cadophora gregata f. sp. sojae]